MHHPIVLVTSRFLLDRREAWDDGYEVIGPPELVDTVADRIEVIVNGGEPLDTRLVDALPALKLVACFTTGYAGIDLALLHSRGIALTSAAGVNAHDVADHAIALMLACRHGIAGADRAVREAKWRDGLSPRPSLQGRRAGIVGFGRIGREIARRAEAFGLSVRWWGPRDKPEAPYMRSESLLALARDSDILFVASRAVSANAKQIDGKVLAALGANGLLVNISRGFLVDEAALIQALESHTIAGAALDVFEQEPANAQLWNRFDNVVLSPHIAGYTREAGIGMFAQLRENLRATSQESPC